MKTQDVPQEPCPVLKSDLRGIEIKKRRTRKRMSGKLKSDLRGIEIVHTRSRSCPRLRLKSDLRGIEMTWLYTLARRSISVKIRP